VFRIINSQNGLPSNTVYEILQDSVGYIWIGHDRGLSRYDGKSFVNYKNPTYPNRAVSNLLLNDSIIYCQDFSRNFYEVQNDSLILLNYINPSPFFTNAFFNSRNQLVSIGNDSLRTIDVVKKKCKGIKLNSKYKYVKANCIKPNGEIIFPLLDIISTQTEYIYQNKGNIYGITSIKPYLIILNKGFKTIPIMKPKLKIKNFIVLKNEIWICTTTGAYCFDLDFNPKYDGMCFFSENSINYVTKDSETNYWFALEDNGVYFVSNPNVLLYKHDNIAITALNSNTKSSILLGTAKNEILYFDNILLSKPVFKYSREHGIV
jgi:ligand-binding sensor domain-containing protein